MITANDIRAEHEAAVAGLTTEQRKALGRLEYARRQCPFNNRGPHENLSALFEAEAVRRNAVLGNA
jgi:hypothetical protein